MARLLVVAVETTEALRGSWPLLFTEYVEKIIRAFVEESSTQETGNMALVAFDNYGTHAEFLCQQTGWTSSVDVFLGWLNSLSFGGGAFGESAAAVALATALRMCCPGPTLPAVPQEMHCLLIAASEPYGLPTPVVRPLVLLNANGQPEYQTEPWWSANAVAVSMAFSACQVSLSVISPRMLPSLRSIYNGARLDPRSAESGAEVFDQYPHHLILISEGFPEGKLAIRRAAVTSNPGIGRPPSIPCLPGIPRPGTPAVTPPQPASEALKFTKVWEGTLAVQIEEQPLPVRLCQLEGYRRTSASEKLAALWPPTIHIVHLIAQEEMSKVFKGMPEILVFRPLQHEFFVNLAKNKECAVIELPLQTLLLTTTDKPDRLQGMLFPKETVVSRANVSTSDGSTPTPDNKRRRLSD